MGLRYSIQDMDRMIRAASEHRSALRKAGRIDDFGRAAPPTSPRQPPEPPTHRGHCMKCKGPKEVVTEGVADTKTSAKRLFGKCPDCGTGVHTFAKAEEAQKVQDALKANLAYTGGV